ncbi:ribosome maturation factor RimP [Egicoccus sp. AB-alg6-2]|uniref:ribosome maturation factor RimP n=1 Tax=Egicoccus sp. AB-alg6-2 TaxID=3242692 RepID=UPI00359CCB0A
MAGTDDAHVPRRIQELASPLADELEVELVDVEVKGQGARRLVRLIADAEGGLDVDVIATLSRRVGAALDEADVIPSSYTLEVTSPGVDRPLRQPRDFARNVGREVRVIRREDIEGAREATGTVVTVDASGVTLDADGAEVVVAFDDIDHGKVVLPW